MNKSVVEKYKIIKSAFWDYNIDPELFLKILNNKIKEDSYFSKEKIFIRLLETLSWYDLVSLLGIEYLRNHLNDNILLKLRNPELRIRYDNARKILHGETLSASGWSSENRERLKSSVLSNRWYGNQ